MTSVVSKEYYLFSLVTDTATPLVIQIRTWYW